MDESVINQFELIFNPNTIAVVGASDTFGKWGFDIFRIILKDSASRKVFPVNRSVTEVQGIKAYPGIRDIPEPVDLVVIVVPAEGVAEIVEACSEKGVKAAIIISAGLGETGGGGAEIEQRIARIAQRSGMRLIGPNCMGHFNTAVNFSTIRRDLPIKKGGVGLISQSGGFAMHLLRCGIETGVGFSKFASTGNEADLHFEDFLEYLAQDNETRVITAYIEGLREGERFFTLAKDITRRKPIALMKVGRTKAGAQATKSHTAAISGADTTYEAMFKQAGVIRADTVEELFDVAAALLQQPLPKGNRVGILTLGGGVGCITTDACEKLGLEIASLSPHTVERLNAVLPSRWPHANPVDTVAAGFVTYPCLWPLMEDDNIDALLAVDTIGLSVVFNELTDSSTPQLRQKADKLFKAQEAEELEDLDKLFEYMHRYQKPVIISGMISEAMKNSRIFNKLKENGVLMYPTPERAVRVLAHLVSYSNYLNHS